MASSSGILSSFRNESSITKRRPLLFSTSHRQLACLGELHADALRRKTSVIFAKI